MAFWKRVLKFAIPITARCTFWSTVAYFGPLTLISFAGPIPLIATGAIVNLGGIEFLLLLV